MRQDTFSMPQRKVQPVNSYLNSLAIGLDIGAARLLPIFFYTAISLCITPLFHTLLQCTVKYSISGVPLFGGIIPTCVQTDNSLLLTPASHSPLSEPRLTEFQSMPGVSQSVVVV